MPHVEVARMTARLPSDAGAFAMFGHTGIAVGGWRERVPRLQTGLRSGETSCGNCSNIRIVGGAGR